MTAILNSPNTNIVPKAVASFIAGTHLRAHRLLGAHTLGDGTRFATWAPRALAVSVVGDFNAWDVRCDPMFAVGDSGVWETVVLTAGPGALYKFAITGADGVSVLHADPYARACEVPPATASVVTPASAYRWHDAEWIERRASASILDAPLAIYELHAGSWRRHADGRPYSYRELGAALPAYVADLGFTHVELMPLMEHPFAGSWGYQTTGYFAPTSRYGTPDDLRYLIDQLHSAGIGAILDWSPAHFPADAHGLARFDGASLYEHDPAIRDRHPDWHTLEFDYARPQVRAFLISSAAYWIEEFHADGIRADAVASMLYLDYSRGPNAWRPNCFGGHENLDAIEFLRALNTELHLAFPGVMVIAEESTSWSGVTRPVSAGGLGFTLKWNLGWMHDTLRYLAHDPVYRRFHHDALTFPLLYAFDEHFVVALSHDEVVHGKRSLTAKMPGDQWQQFASVRLLLSFQYLSPGKKLLFMGDEIATPVEWNHDGQLDWSLLADRRHDGVQRLVRDLNRLYRAQPALYCGAREHAGFAWLDCHDTARSVIAFMRSDGDTSLVAVLNFTPVPHHGYHIGVPAPGVYREIFNSDAGVYGGSNVGNAGSVISEACPRHGHMYSIAVTVPPLAAVVLQAPRRGHDEDVRNIEAGR